MTPTKPNSHNDERIELANGQTLSNCEAARRQWGGKQGRYPSVAEQLVAEDVSDPPSPWASRLIGYALVLLAIVGVIHLVARSAA